MLNNARDLPSDYTVLSKSYHMVCPHVRGENPRDLASGLSPVHVDKHGISQWRIQRGFRGSLEHPPSPPPPFFKYPMKMK